MNGKTRDNLLYLGIALGIAAIALGPLVYALNRGSDIPEFPIKPAWVGGSTIVLIAYMVQDLKRRRLRVRRALPSLLCVACIHVAASAVILHTVERVPLLLLGVGIFVEAHLALQIIEKLVMRPGNPNAH